MTVLERKVEAAFLSGEDIRWMHGYFRGLLDSGTDSKTLLSALQNLYAQFIKNGDDHEADLTLDAMDFLTGWCGPGMALSHRAKH
jgi:hypothetical protein